MTLKSWCKEFMPKMPTKRLTKLQAIEHSLRKWKGLTKANLKKHDLSREHYWIEDGEKDSLLDIDADTCALCVKYYDDKADTFRDACLACPLFRTLGKPCDHLKSSPYAIWKDTGNPNPMIRALEKTLEREMAGE